MPASVVALLRQHDYAPIGKLEHEEAMAMFRSGVFNAVIIGGGVDVQSRN